MGNEDAKFYFFRQTGVFKKMGASKSKHYHFFDEFKENHTMSFLVYEKDHSQFIIKEESLMEVHQRIMIENNRMDTFVSQEDIDLRMHVLIQQKQQRDRFLLQYPEYKYCMFTIISE
jgi:hypothetical protein